MPYADPIQEAQYQKAYRQRHKEKLRAQRQAWAETNKDSLAVKKRQDYERNTDAYKARAKRHQERNAERIKAMRSTPEYKAKKNAMRRAKYASSAEAREATLRQCRDYRLQNRDEISRRKKLNRAKEPLWQRRERQGMSKAGSKGALIGDRGKLKSFYQRVYSGESKECEYCKCSVALPDIVINHKEPFTHGGRHEVANLAVSCKPCNRVKLGMPFKQWLELLAQGGNVKPTARPFLPIPFPVARL